MSSIKRVRALRNEIVSVGESVSKMKKALEENTEEIGKLNAHLKAKEEKKVKSKEWHLVPEISESDRRPLVKRTLTFFDTYEEVEVVQDAETAKSSMDADVALKKLDVL